MIVDLDPAPTSALVPRTSCWRMFFSPRECRFADLLPQWENLLQASGNLNAMYQAPEWLACMQATHSPRHLALALLPDDAGMPIGLAPLCVEPHDLHFHVSGRILGTMGLQAVFVLGGQPLLPPEPKLHDAFFAALATDFPHCQAIALSTVPVDGFLWRYLHTSQAIQQRFLLHIPEGIEHCHTCAVPESFAEYNAKFTAKKRYNLKRQARILRARGGGHLELRRIESRNDLPLFRDAIHAVSIGNANGSPQKESRLEYDGLAERAERGLLRCYALQCGNDYVAWARGYQYRGVYHVVLTHYHRNFARFSPGTVLHYLMIKDLIEHQRPQMISFGYGDPVYPHQSCNQTLPYARVLLLRRNLANHCRQFSHLRFRQLVRFLRARVLAR